MLTVPLQRESSLYNPPSVSQLCGFPACQMGTSTNPSCAGVDLTTSGPSLLSLGWFPQMLVVTGIQGDPMHVLSLHSSFIFSYIILQALISQTLSCVVSTRGGHWAPLIGVSLSRITVWKLPQGSQLRPMDSLLCFQVQAQRPFII